MRQRSLAWHQARCGRITGTRFAKAMASKGTQGYRGLIEDLVAERLYGRWEEVATTAAMQWGVAHEDAARRWYTRTAGHAVRQVAFVVHPTFDFVGVSPDGLVGDDGLLEIKCPQQENFARVMRAREMPSRYRWQVQGQLWVCQRSWLDFVAYYPPRQGIVIPVVACQADFDRLADRCTEVDAEVARIIRSRAQRRPGEPPSAPLATQVPPDSGEPTESGASGDMWGWPWWAWLCALIALVLLVQD